MPQFRLIISHDTDTGQINVEGPVEQPLLCYGMLECAKEAISEAAADRRRKVQPPTADDLAKLKLVQ